MNKPTPQLNAPISISLFYMWRCVIVVAHADGRVHEKEKEYLDGIFSNMDRVYGLTDAQKKIFADDIENPKNMADLLKYINDPAVRSQLIYFAGILAWADGELSPSEDILLKKLRSDQLASLDLAQIRKDVKVAVDNEMFQHDIKALGVRPQGGLIELLDRFLLWLGIDVLG